MNPFKKSKFMILVLIFTITFLCSCSNKITQGEVIDKHYSPAYDQTLIIPFSISNGKTSTTVFIPYIYHYSDKYEITIQAWNEKNNEMQTASYRVTKDVYENIDIGSEFLYDENMEPKYPEYTRERQDKTNDD